MNGINVGEVVKLKSGGPKMTVNSVGQDSNGVMTAWCSWFDKQDKEFFGSFPITSLENAAIS
jgi:uncharacterized protein YodC (DUF2158 family)